MPGESYPLCLYRPGAFFEWDGHPTDSCVVNDEDEHLRAAEDGWQESADYFAFLSRAPDPLDHDGDGQKGGSLPAARRAPKLKAEADL